MAEKFDNKMLMDPKSWVQYRQFVDSKKPIGKVLKVRFPQIRIGEPLEVRSKMS